MAIARFHLSPNLHLDQYCLLGPRIDHFSSLRLRPRLTDPRHIFAVTGDEFHHRPGHLRLAGTRTERPPFVPGVLESTGPAELRRLFHPLHPHGLHQTYLSSHRVRRAGARAGIKIRPHSRTIHLVRFLITGYLVICQCPTRHLVYFCVDGERRCYSCCWGPDSISVVGLGFHRHLLGDSSSLFGEFYDKLGLRYSRSPLVVE